MGGDFGPDVVLAGAARALAADPDLHLVVVGPSAVVEPFVCQDRKSVV